MTGRPAFLSGETQRVLLAIPAAAVLLPGPECYLMATAIDGTERKTVHFSAMHAAPGAPPPS